MGQALYRKYRSKSFDELVGQEHIVQTLRSALSKGQISHAYLFSGPRGVGKTSAARLLAYGVNELPYGSEETHLDIIEIDAASNRRIDEVRDIREKVHILPTTAKYKVYIIDEAHMLTKEAFNALLKTLEEPPEHCVFILATTEAHKLPETIVSRTQRFTFHPVSEQQIARHLAGIAKAEKIKIDQPSLALIAQHGRGSFRDSIGMLDQLSGLDRPVGIEDVRLLLGIPSDDLLDSLIEAVSNADTPKIVGHISIAQQGGYSAASLASGLSAKLREKLLAGDSHAWIVMLLKDLLLVASSPMPYDQLELSLIEAASGGIEPAKPAVSSPAASAAVAEPASKTAPASKPSKASKAVGRFNIDDWPEFVSMVRNEAASLYTALRLAHPEVEGSILRLKFSFPLHQKKIDNPKSKRLIGDIIERQFGAKVELECVVDKSIATPATKKLEQSPPELIQTISNIFGGSEVLES